MNAIMGDLHLASSETVGFFGLLFVPLQVVKNDFRDIMYNGMLMVEKKDNFTEKMVVEVVAGEVYTETITETP